MSTELHPRPYQTECLSAVWGAWDRGVQRPAVVLPTGSGKTIVFAHLARQFIELARMSGTPHRVVVLVHRDELADQAIDKIESIAPDLHVGKVKAADDEVYADVMVCSVQTLARSARLERLTEAAQRMEAATGKPGGIGLVIVDEAHHAAASSYQKIMQALGCFSGLELSIKHLPGYGADRSLTGTRTLGVTATMARGDGVGLGDTWQEIVFSRSVLWMISRGFLTDVRGKAVDLDDLHLGDVKKSGGDYQAKDLGRAIIAARGPEIVARALLTYAADRRPIVFLPDVASAHATTLALTGAGIPAATVDGETPRADRLEIYRRYRTGELRAIVNCMVLTEGADFPWADCVVNARPTTNPVLYVQMIGRGLRPWPGKTDCLVLDVTGAGGRLSTLIDLAPGEVASFRDGESLADAAVREAAEGDVTVEAENLAFNLKHRELDLFSSSGHAWLRTPAGVMFIPVANEEIFLWANDGHWDVCHAPQRGKWTRLHREMPLGTAMAWAETEAEDRMPFNGTKSADWRKRRAEPRQIVVARSYRVDVGDDPRKGELSDAISIAKATEKFDEWMRRAK
jgi:superfamily II DNA or RNA helicase